MNNAQKKFAWFAALSLAGILFVSFVPTAFHIGAYGFRKVDFASDIKKEISTTGNNTTAGSKITIPGKPVFFDSTRPDYNTYKDIINYSRSSNQPLAKFVSALQQYQRGRRKKIRIAYLGDSFIEGDIITGDLREMLQKRFGGAGVGFVPIKSVGAGIRQTISHVFSNSWSDENIKRVDDTSNIFISGHNYKSHDSWVQYISVAKPGLDSFYKAYLLYQSVQPVALTLNGRDTILPAAPQISNTLLTTNVHQLTASFPSAGPVIYGFSFESDTGILIDNYSFRGITGAELRFIHPAVLSQTNAVLPYDLIVFEYGPNLLFSPAGTRFGYYVPQMVKAVEQIRDAFPQADILMISTGDKAFKYDGEYATAKGVVPLLQVQQQVAAGAGVNFWNLYLNMGGEGSMIKWVEGDTAFALKDYTHVNFKGGKKIAGLLFNTLMNAYKNFK